MPRATQPNLSTLAIAVTRRLRDFTLAVDLELGPGVTALVGPSGCGKTTLLRLVCGLLRPDTGTIRLGDTLLDDAARGYHLPPGRRGLSMVFQEYALFPHLSVADNVAYGLRARRVARAERHRRTGAMLERLGIAALAGERPTRLSGGQRQRVALARALVLEPRALLLDEPLAALDIQTRARVRQELRDILSDLEIPTLLVTHDYADALAFRERIVVMDAGHVVQDGAHADLLARPASRFVADFTGINYLEGMLESAATGATDVVGALRRVHLIGAERIELYVAAEGIAPPPGPVSDPASGPESGPLSNPMPVGLSLRPWDVVLSIERPVGSARNVLRGRVRQVLPLGGRVRVALALAPGQEALPPPDPVLLAAEISLEAQADLACHEGQQLYASFKATAVTMNPTNQALPHGASRDGGRT